LNLRTISVFSILTEALALVHKYLGLLKFTTSLTTHYTIQVINIVMHSGKPHCVQTVEHYRPTNKTKEALGFHRNAARGDDTFFRFGFSNIFNNILTF